MKFNLNQIHDRVRNESQFKYYVSILGGLNVLGQANLPTWGQKLGKHTNIILERFPATRLLNYIKIQILIGLSFL